MKPIIRWLAPVAAAIVLVGGGAMWGAYSARQGQSDHQIGSSRFGKSASSSVHDVTSGTKPTRPTHNDLAQKARMERLHNAMRLPKESRIKPLLGALEESGRYPLSQDVVDAMRKIMDEGEAESCHYLLSLLEQREEKPAIDLISHALGHRDHDVADRALFALEAVAGMVFENREKARAWAATWQPNPERIRLFAVDGGNDPEPAAPADFRIPGNCSRVHEDAGQKPE